MPTAPPRIFTLPFGCVLAFAGGVGATRWLSSPTEPLLLLISCSAAVFSFLQIPRRPQVLPRPALLATSLVAFFFGTGGWLEAFHHRQFASAPLLHVPALISESASDALLVQGWVAGDPIFRRDRLRFVFQVEKGWWHGTWHSCPGTVRVSVRDPERQVRLRYGERLEMPLRLRRARNFMNPGAIDYRRSLEAEGIHLLGSCKNRRLLRRIPGLRGGSIPSLAHALRRRLLSRLENAFPGESGEESRRFLGAILLGERDGGEGRYDPLLRKSGVYHILSISGLHFVLLMACLHRLARSIRVGAGPETILLGLIGGFYVLLSGGDDPILRSALAGLVQTMGRWTGRRVSAWNAQSEAALLLLAYRPLHLFQPGFQLSFLATFGILAGARPWWPRLRRVPVAGEALAVSASAWVASSPLMAALFFQVSPVALVMNLLAGPFLSLCLTLGAGVLFLPLRMVTATLTSCLDLFAWICAFAIQVPGAFLRVPCPSFPLLGGITVLLLARSGLGSTAGRRDSCLLSCGVLFGLALICFPPAPWPRPDSLALTALDVGQGDSLLLGLPGGHWVLVDGGGFAASDFDVGEWVVLPALMALGVRSLDLVVLTHAHQDHGGGLSAVLEAFPVKEIWVGRTPPDSPLVMRLACLASRRGIPLLHPTRGSFRCLGRVCFEVLHPPLGYRRGAAVSNEDSLVLRVTYHNAALLLTGDVESEGEALLLDSGLPISAEILKVAHHGSASSTSARFLERVSPIMAIVSVGTGNPWGHPSEKVLRRLREYGITTHRTDREGAIGVVSYGRGWEQRSPNP